MMTKNLANDLHKEGILVVSFCPGWVKTDLGGPNAPVSTELVKRSRFMTYSCVLCSSFPLIGSEPNLHLQSGIFKKFKGQFTETF